MPTFDDVIYQISLITKGKPELYDIARKRPIEIQALTNILQEGEVLFHCLIATEAQSEQNGLLFATPFRAIFISQINGYAYPQILPYHEIQSIRWHQQPFEHIEIFTTHPTRFYVSHSQEFVQTIQSILYGTSYDTSNLISSPNQPIPNLYEPQTIDSQEEYYENSAFHEFEVDSGNRKERIKEGARRFSIFLVKVGTIAGAIAVVALGALWFNHNQSEAPSSYYLASELNSSLQISKISFEEYFPYLTGWDYIQHAVIENGVVTLSYYPDFDSFAKEKERTPSLWENEDLFNDFFSQERNVYKIVGYDALRVLTFVKDADEVNIELTYKGKRINVKLTKNDMKEKLGIPIDDIKTEKDWRKWIEKDYFQLEKQKKVADIFIRTT